VLPLAVSHWDAAGAYCLANKKQIRPAQLLGQLVAVHRLKFEINKESKIEK
jgi:hypothetical protein